MLDTLKHPNLLITTGYVSLVPAYYCQVNMCFIQSGNWLKLQLLKIFEYPVIHIRVKNRCIITYWGLS